MAKKGGKKGGGARPPARPPQGRGGLFGGDLGADAIEKMKREGFELGGMGGTKKITHGRGGP